MCIRDRKGAVYGETYEFGYKPTSGRVSVHDIQSTILHLLGFDHEEFTYDFQGRPFRLTDVEGEIIREILA